MLHPCPASRSRTRPGVRAGRGPSRPNPTLQRSSLVLFARRRGVEGADGGRARGGDESREDDAEDVGGVGAGAGAGAGEV